MDKLAKLAMAMSALFIPDVANATPPAGTFTGQVTVHDGITLTCSITIDIDHSQFFPVATIALSQGDLWCPYVSFNLQPYPATLTEGPTGSGTYIFTYVDMTTPTFGDCVGHVQGTWNTSLGGTILYIDTVLPPRTPGSANCTIVGTASN